MDQDDSALGVLEKIAATFLNMDVKNRAPIHRSQVLARLLQQISPEEQQRVEIEMFEHIWATEEQVYN